MNKYIFIKNEVFKANNVEKINNDILFDSLGNVVSKSNLSIKKAYTMVDVMQDVEKLNKNNYLELVEKYGMTVYSSTKNERIYLLYEGRTKNRFIIDVKKRRVYDVSKESKNLFNYCYFIHDNEFIEVFEKYESENRVDVLKIHDEIVPYRYYKNIDLVLSADVLTVGEYYGLTFDSSIVFVTKDDYSKIVGKTKEYYVIRSGEDYEVFRSKHIEYFDSSVLKQADVYTCDEKTNFSSYANVINNTYIYDQDHLYKINHDSKTIELIMEWCEEISNRKYTVFISGNQMKKIAHY